MELATKDLVRIRLENLAAKHNGLLTPEAVVADAKDPTSPLHEHFEWNVKKAAMSHWIDTARMLIRSVRVIVTTERSVLSTVAYVRDPSLPSGEQGYRAITSIRTDKDKARETVIAEFGRAESVLRRAKEIAEALDMEDDVEQIIEMVGAATEKAVATV